MATLATPPAIEIRNLKVRRGRKPVLADVSLTVAKGSITGLLGPSGCGKTTLMRSMVGTQVVESGTVTVLGRAAGSRCLHEHVGYVTQAPSIYDDLTVIDNVAYFAALYGCSRADVTAVIATVGLTGQALQRGNQLSGGQRTRVSLACALVASPDLLVLDEPTVGLDPVLRAELWEQFHTLARGGVTLVVSSHVMDEAEHCDQLLLMRDGALLAEMSPDELRRCTGEDSLEKAFLTLVRMGRQ